MVVNVANIVIADTTKPLVKIGNPINGSKVNGSVLISVAASDDSGAAGISQTLVINGKNVATATGGLLSYNWNTRKLLTGTYTVQAVVRDVAGNSATQSVQVSK